VKRLYLETNYIVGQAFEQDPIASTIFAEAARADAELCLPSICIQEALTTVQLRRKSANKLKSTLQQQIEGLRDDRSATAAAVKTSINTLIVQNGRLHDERDLRIASVVASLAFARFIELEHGTAMAALTVQITAGAADNLILHVVCQDAQRRPVTSMALLTMNTRDFAKPAVVEALAASGIILLPSSSDAIAWLQT
jgi:hypothetical protein